MVDFNSAFKSAKELNEAIDYFTEYEKCFVFSEKTSDEIGGNGPVVVDKENGKCYNFVYAIMNGLVDNKVIKEGKC